MVKMFGKIQHKHGFEGTGPDGLKEGVKCDVCKLLSGIMVKGDWT